MDIGLTVRANFQEAIGGKLDLLAGRWIYAKHTAWFHLRLECTAVCDGFSVHARIAGRNSPKWDQSAFSQCLKGEESGFGERGKRAKAREVVSGQLEGRGSGYLPRA